jgi:hypothetical protein
MSDIIKKDPTNIDDGFAGWTDNVEGSERPQGAGVIQGVKIKFGNDATWLERDDNEMPPNLELVAVAIGRYVQRWQDQQPIETIPIASEQPFPDIEAMNEKVPRKEWTDGPDGKPRGPYQACSVVYLVNLNTMDRYSFPAPTVTIGSSIAVRELRDKIMWMRRLRGLNTYPVVVLSDTFFPTRFGGRQRPHFKIVRWIRLDGEGGQVEALPPPTAKERQPDMFAKSADEPAQQTTSQSDLPLNEVKEPSLAEELNDKIPDFESEKAESPKAAAQPLPNPRRNHKKPPAKTSAKKPPPKRASNILDAG